MQPQETPNNQSNLNINKKSGSIKLLDFRLHYKAIVIKTVWYWPTTDTQIKGTESPEINPCTYWSINLRQMRQEYTIWNTHSKWYWEKCTATCKIK